MRDLAVERADGLGWWFALAFLVQAAMPGVAATGLAINFGKEYAVPLALASVLAYFPIWLVVRGALRKKKKIERLRTVLSSGHRAWGDIVHVELLSGRTKSGGRRYRSAVVFLKVEVPGFAPHDVETSHWYPAADIARLTPGTRVPVVVAPDNHNEAVIFDVPATPIYVQQQSSPMVGFGQPFGAPPAHLPPHVANAVAKAQRSNWVFLVLGGLGMAIGMPAIFFFAFSATNAEAEVVDKFLARLDNGNYDGAYDLLTEETQQQVGSPEELGEAWEKAGVRVQGKTGFSCSVGGFGKWRIGRSATVEVSGPAKGFEIGVFHTKKCSSRVTADLEERGGKPRIVAIRVR